MTVPSLERERLRDLVRCREDIRADLVRARHRLGKFLLRREIYYEGPGRAWSRGHRAWLAGLRFADRASQLTMADYLHAHDVLLARRDRVEDELSKLAAGSPCAVAISRLRCLRGIDTLSALGLCAEIGAWERFDHPDQLSAYIGIVPSEHTTSQPAPPGVDHQGRLDPRPPAADRGVVSLPPASRCRRGARAPPARPAAGGDQYRLACAAPPARPLAPAQRRPQETQRRSSPSRSPASSPASAGRSPPGAHPDRCHRHPCRRATPSRRHAPSHRSRSPQSPETNPQPVAADEAARASRHSRTTSPRHPHEHPWPHGPAALDFRQRTCDENKVLG